MPHGSELLADMRPALAAFIDQPDAAALGLPLAIYGSRDIYEKEIGAIFEKEWICVGREEEVAEPGQYFAVDVVGDPLLVVRGADRRIRVLSNVCRHKGARLVEGEGRADSFSCPYHAWTYGLDGKLLTAPYMDRSEGFDRGRCRLPELRSEAWHGFIYVNLDPDAAPFAEGLRDLEPHVEAHHMADMRLFTGGVEVWATNWKLLSENFTENYHTFCTHRHSLQSATPTEFTCLGTSGEHFSLFYTPISPKNLPREPHHPSLSDEQRKRVVMVNVFPNHVIALSPERVVYMCLLPLGPDQVQIRWGAASFGEKLTYDTLDNIARFYRKINDEDKAMLENIQRGVHARYAERGHLSWMEQTNRDFGRYIARKLTETR